MRKIVSIAALFVSCLSFQMSDCLASGDTQATTLQVAKAEKILGYEPTRSGVIFQVTSGGCTNKADFVNTMKRDEASGVLLVTLLRTRPDLCYPFLPTGERLFFSFEELGMSPTERFIIQNQNGVIQGWIW